ncbi:MAG: hypothetical protein QXH91_04340 [Candidatus Bathyarchaeia archaeon]
MKDWGKIEVKIKGPLGVAKPFRQGGTWRITIPKRAVKEHDLEVKTKKEYFSYIFVDTDKGLLLLPLDKVVNPKNLRDALKFVDISHLSEEDLKILFKEEI